MWQKYREHTPEILIGLLFSIVLIVALATPPNPIAHVLERAEMALYDLRLRLGEGFVAEPNTPIVIIDIDELSQKQEGRWPWRRDRVVTLIERIGAKEPAVIVLDVLFGLTEPQPVEADPSRQCTADYCPITSRITDEDRQLAATFAKYDVVSGFLFHSGKFVTGALPATAKPQPDDVLNFQEPTGYATNPPLLQQASKAEGFINTYLGDDGMARRLPLFQAYDDFLYPSLALAAAQRFLMEKDWQLRTASMAGKTFYEGISVGNKNIPTDQAGNILIPFNVGKAPFSIISATHIMRNPDNTLDSLEGAIVIVGASAILLGDLKTTPIQTEMPGTFIHAYAINGLLNPDMLLLHEPAWGLTAELLLLGAIALLTLLMYPQCGPRQLLIGGTFFALIITVANVWIWREQQIRLDLLPSLVLIVFLTGLFVIYDLLRENRTRHQLQYLFGQYVPPAHISRILEQPQAITFEGEKREMSVLFADLHEFTSIAERLDTQTLKHLLNSYLNAATEVIFHNSGTIDKYIGDMVMAFWNAPLREPHHARQAVLCAMGLRKMLTDKADEFRQFGITPLQLGIGINTGEMNVGDMGSDHRRAYTVLGDAVNLAARIESLTRFYAVDILVSEHTAAQCQGITFRTIDRVRVKGKRETVLLYQPLGLIAELSPALQRLHELHERAMRCYWCRDWEHASKLFARILIESPDEHIAGMYLQRIAALIPQSLPDSWDGVYEHRRK